MGRHGNQNSANTVNTADIVDLAVSEAKLAADAVTSAKIKDGEIANADVSASAAIVPTKLDLSSAWVSSGAVSLDGGLDTGDDNTLKFKVVDIGDWNMDSTTSHNVAHGLTLSTIRMVTATIISDDGNTLNFVTYNKGSANITDVGITLIDSTNVSLERNLGGAYDNTNYDSTSYNRGHVTIWYTA